MLVRLETDNGLYGWGEGGQYGPAEPVASAVHGIFAPLLIGCDPRAVEVLWERMYSLTRDFGRKGTIVEAISAIDIALWDLFGKSHGSPVHELMGGGFRSSVKTYATGLYYHGEPPFPLEPEIESVRQEASEYLSASLPAVKMKIGLLSPAQDLERVAAARQTLGDSVLLMVDANHAYAAHTACRVARSLESYDVYWFEEPVVPEDLNGYCQVKAATRIAIAGGECEHTRYGFSKWIAGRALDIVQPDPCCAGGLTETRRIASMASAFHVQCIPHVWGSGIALAAGLHLLATLPPVPATGNPIAPYNEPMLEWDAGHNPLRTDLLVEPIFPLEGEVVVPAGPGLGVDVDDEVLQTYLSAHAFTGASTFGTNHHEVRSRQATTAG
jgi:D-galactarolactone cycloisomerase